MGNVVEKGIIFYGRKTIGALLMTPRKDTEYTYPSNSKPKPADVELPDWENFWSEKLNCWIKAPGIESFLAKEVEQLEKIESVKKRGRTWAFTINGDRK